MEDMWVLNAIELSGSANQPIQASPSEGLSAYPVPRFAQGIPETYVWISTCDESVRTELVVTSVVSWLAPIGESGKTRRRNGRIVSSWWNTSALSRGIGCDKTRGTKPSGASMYG